MSLNAPTDKATDLFYLAALSSRRGEKVKAIEYAEEAIRLLLREEPQELALKLEKRVEICRTARA